MSSYEFSNVLPILSLNLWFHPIFLLSKFTLQFKIRGNSVKITSSICSLSLISHINLSFSRSLISKPQKKPPYPLSHTHPSVTAALNPLSPPPSFRCRCLAQVTLIFTSPLTLLHMHTLTHI